MTKDSETGEGLAPELQNLRRLAAELEGLVLSRTNSLEELRAQAAARRSESIMRLAEGLCHEVLNPLSIILLTLHKLSIDGSCPPGAYAHIEAMEEQARRIHDIVKELVAFSRRLKHQSSPPRS